MQKKANKIAITANFISFECDNTELMRLYADERKYKIFEKVQK